MREMVVTCRNCGAENPESVEFCIRCGKSVGPPESLPSSPVSRSRSVTARGAIISIAVVLAIVLLPLGLSYSQPWSKIKVIATNSEFGSIGVCVYIDGHLKSDSKVARGSSILGVWSVDAGAHLVEIDNGSWYESSFPDHYYVRPDGMMDFAHSYEVGPLTTKNVYIDI